ncbi:insulin-like growth factor-binding protein complex acid labile subunit [Mytilus trossulus]|uniref:insulin-like growth factor-binding protein complex acid labile subunit n=1 Tax=Mytilus trossulus TaxID=6551 RepID=UPI0030048A68
MYRCLLACLILIICCHGSAVKQIVCPDDCLCTGRNFDCSDKDLSVIPSGISNAAKSLDLQKNQIADLSSNPFSKLQLLRILNLGFNSLTQIRYNDFNGLVNLRTLDLSFNRINTIHKNSFRNLDKISDIVLRGNELTNIDGIFTYMNGMVRLDLSNNQIDKISSESFKNMTNLRYLLLGSNRITSIEVKAFNDNNLISFISLTGNPVIDVDGLFIKNNVLSFIELTNCSLKTFPKGLPRMTRFLYLDQNNITSITKKEIEPVESLVNLFISENQIQFIERDAFAGLRGLQELWINFNQINEVPIPPLEAKKLHIDNNNIAHVRKNDFQFGSKLETLSIKNNQISVINAETFENLTNLLSLYLGGNSITVLPDNAFKPLLLLKDLGLTGMDFDYIGKDVFNKLNNLDKLIMSFVMIGENALQGNIFKHLSNLRILDLQDSPELASHVLESEDMMKSLFTVEDINLMDNEIKTVNSNIMKYLPRLHTIRFEGNQFHCDLRLRWLWKWIDMQKYKFENADSLQCFSPPQLRGSTFLSLKFDQFVPTTLKQVVLSTKGQVMSKTTKSPHVILNSTNLGNETLTFEMINDTVNENLDSSSLPPGYVPNQKDLVRSQNQQDKDYEDKINKILIITVVTTLAVVLFAVIVTTVSCLKCNRKKDSYNRTDTFPDNDVTFYVISDEAPPLPPPNTTRKDRGSVSSTRDITNDNVFIIDNDSS